MLSHQERLPVIQIETLVVEACASSANPRTTSPINAEVLLSNEKEPEQGSAAA